MATGRNKTHNYSEAEYRRKWLYQLQSEFKMICHWYRIALTAPAFRVIDSRSTLGLWEPAARTISISSVLIGECSWDTVINVLKHEMAHQYVHEIMGRGMELPHGPAFEAACEKLGVPYPFNTGAGDSPKIFTDADQHSPDLEYDKRVAKVRKMLSLAGSANRHEAAVAMSKANSFIRRYNLERLDKANEGTQYRYTIKNTGRKRLHVIERRIAGILMDFFYVDVVYAELFDAGKAESHKTIELLGTFENIAFASHVYDFLRQRVELLWDGYRCDSRAPGKLRKTYILGLLQGFREKLEREEKACLTPAGIDGGIEKHKTISGLVVAKDNGLTEFIAGRFPRLRKVRYNTPEIRCRSTFSAGKHEGGKITINKPVEHKDGNLGRLLASET